MSNYMYLVGKRLMPLDSMNEGDALEVKFEVYRVFEDGNEDDTPSLEGTVDWQDGVMIYQKECIEPDQWSAIMACALEAIKEAKTMIGENWKLGGLSDPA